MKKSMFFWLFCIILTETNDAGYYSAVDKVKKEASTLPEKSRQLVDEFLQNDRLINVKADFINDLNKK